MRLTCSVAALLFLGGPGSVQAQWVTGQPANVILGQKTPDATGAGLSADTFNNPTGIALDLKTGKLFIADRDNHRVLRWSPIVDTVTGSAAEAVFGQADFNSRAESAARNGMNAPTALAVDAEGRLFVVDAANNRVLRFDNASDKPTGADADAVFGQQDFVSNAPALTRSGLNNPQGIAIDSAGRLFVADGGNHRVLRFDNAASKPNGTNADGVLGQPDFVTAHDTTTQSGMSAPHGLAIDRTGSLLVAVTGSNRVLKFDQAATKPDGANADFVIGQPDFQGNSAATSATSLNGPIGVTVDLQGLIYVNDAGNNRCVWFDADSLQGNDPIATGAIGQTNLTSNSQGAALSGMHRPGGIAVHPSNPSLWICDAGNNRVLHFTQATPTSVKGEERANIPSGFILYQNYPNPFNPSTLIRFALPTAAYVRLEVFNILGERIATLVEGKKDAGYFSERFDGAGLASGVYVYRLFAGDFVATKRLLVVK